MRRFVVLPRLIVPALALCLCLTAVPALAGENIVWNGAGQPGTNGQLRPVPGYDGLHLFPDSSSGNWVRVNGDMPDGFVFGGWDLAARFRNAEAANNRVDVSGGKIWDVTGGEARSESGSATVTGNSVDVSGNSEIDSSVYGGFARSESGSAAATNNSVNVSGGKIWDVTGGEARSESGSATVTGNSVDVSGNSEIDSSVFGGSAQSDSGNATANNNSVDVSGGEISRDVYGGYAESKSGNATATNNSVDVSGNSKSDGYVIGGYAVSESGSATATNNSVDVSGGKIGDNVFGGYATSDSGNATATGNSTSVSGNSQIGIRVIGGYATSYSGNATATGNSTSVSGNSQIGANVYGGYAVSQSGSATATNNSVDVSGGKIDFSVHGGSVESDSSTATATGNRVNISGNSEIGNAVYGGYASSRGNATGTGNRVSVSGNSRITKNIFGSYVKSSSGNATAANNSVSVSDNSDIGGEVYGGHAFNNSDSATTTAEATGNSVNISGGDIALNVFGGYAKNSYGNSTVTNNRVNISGGEIGTSVFGGFADNDSGSATATGNRVDASGGKINGDVTGGNAVSSHLDVISSTPGTASVTAMNNSVYVSGNSEIGARVQGGYAESDSGSATVTGNSVDVSGNSDISGNVYGGYAESDSGSATATNNRVNISGGESKAEIYGGYAVSDFGSATATGNSVSVSGGEIGEHVQGGSALSVSGNVTATDNRTIISGGEIKKNVYGGYTWSDSGSATATGNSVDVSGGKLSNVDGVGHLHGGFAWSEYGNATATDNRVSVSGNSEINYSVHGGYASSDSGSSTATDNRTIISGGKIKYDVHGGYAWSRTGSAAATGNSVVVSGGEIQGDVYGGFASSDFDSVAATGNSVTLTGAPLFNANSTIYGGRVIKFGTIDPASAFSDNTLNIWNYSGANTPGAAPDKVQNFQNYNFILPASLQNGDTLFKANHVYFGDGAGLDSTVNGINFMSGGAPAQAGYSVTLIDANFIGIIDNNNSTITGQKGVSLLYDWYLEQSGNTLTATTFDGPRINPQTKALAEGRVAGMAFINQGSDLIAGAGMETARRGAPATNGDGGENGDSSASGTIIPFIVGQGGSSRYDTGSHVDVDGFSLIAGLAWNTGTDYGSLMLGAFFEAGWGSYDSRNSFSGFASVKGDGDTEYYGGGLMSRFDFNGNDTGNLYAEASLRAGWAETDFSSSDLRDPMGKKTDYDSDAAYYGAHLGLGYLWNAGENSTLDLYAKYFWMHQDSDSVSPAGDPVKFKSADSHRLRGGARFSHTLATEKGLTFTPYIGAAYEHEFGGEAKATTYGHKIDAPELTGGTGIGELGFTLKPKADSSLSFDLGVQGYTGMREGVSGSFKLKWAF